jgi:hypothetical protein
VSFLDGRIETVAVEDLPRYVTERGNPRNELGVQRAVLYWPAEELRDGVFLVDTPGVGSVYRHNTEAARAFIPQSDAAIFLTSADPPISDGERAFLEDVRAHAARMFFVLNKVDYLSERDRQEALAFTGEVLEQALGERPRVYPVSARQGLVARLVGDEAELEASGMGAFERDFRRFLMREKGAAILASVSGQGRKLLADARNALDVEDRARQIPVEELAGKAQAMERVFVRVRESREDIRTLLRREEEKLVAMVERDLDGLRREASRALVGQAERFLAETAEVRSAAREVDKLVRRSLRREVERWRAEEDRRVGRAFREATSRYVEETNRLVARTVRLCGELMEVALSSADSPAGISPDTRFTYSFFEAPTIMESLLPDLSRLLPASVVRRRLGREVRERVPALVDRHCGRLRWDFLQRLERSRVALERALDERLDTTVESLREGVRRALEERWRSEEEARAVRARVHADRRRLDALATALARAGEWPGEGGEPDEG